MPPGQPCLLEDLITRKPGENLKRNAENSFAETRRLSSMVATHPEGEQFLESDLLQGKRGYDNGSITPGRMGSFH